MTIKKIHIALAGNPNCGKTTLFNALTGSNQYVGNWPGVTVEKKEGYLKGNRNVIVQDLPGIYSLSPYSPEEVVSRKYLVEEHPDVILNIVDGTNLERNLYLTSQLMDLHIPMVLAINMMDVVVKSGNKVNTARLAEKLHCPVVEISALEGKGIPETIQKVIDIAGKDVTRVNFSLGKTLEDSLQQIEEQCLADIPFAKQRWTAVKLFERDDLVCEESRLSEDKDAILEKIIHTVEEQEDDDSESILTNARYERISELLSDVQKKINNKKVSISDEIDKIVTNRWLGLPIFALVMFIMYYFSIQTVGTIATDWVNDGLFGDGWFWGGIGREKYDDYAKEYSAAQERVGQFLDCAEDENLLDTSDDKISILNESALQNFSITEAVVHDEDGNIDEKETILNYTYQDYEKDSVIAEPDPSEYGPWQNGIPVMLEHGLENIHCVPWLQSLILDGIVAGIGAILGFLPQMMVLFLFLAFLEGCGYMSRIAFVMDRIFHHFGLSGKSFIPMLIGTGCGVPAVMASRTIENDRDRRMTVMTTTFIPCSAKLPIIALVAGSFFHQSGLVAVSAYFIGVLSIVLSGIILKKTKMFAGDPAPFVMELPAYHWPTLTNIYQSVKERSLSFMKKAGSVILLASIFIWFLSSYGWTGSSIQEVSQENSFLANIGNAMRWLFVPLGFGNWQSTVAVVMGLVAKENVVGTMGILYGVQEVAENGWQIFQSMNMAFSGSVLAGYSFLVFNLLCAPCFAAIGAIRKEMNSVKWTWCAIGWQCGWAYAISLTIFQLGSFLQTGIFTIWTGIAFVVLLAILYALFRRQKVEIVNKNL